MSLETTAMRDPALGERRSVVLPGGRIAYTDSGSGRPVVFVHGLLVNANLWRKVVPLVVDAGFRCLTPDWPLGAHSIAMSPQADLTPPGIAHLILEFLEELDLDDVTIVANDTGGALTQILMANHPERIGRVVLTPCDAFEEFFPAPYDRFPTLMRWPGAIWMASRLLPLPVVYSRASVFGCLTKQPIPADVMDSYLGPIRDDGQIRRDAKRFIVEVDSKYTLAAATMLPEFDKPVLLVRAADDRVFAPQLFERLAATLPNAELVTVADSCAFVPEDQPNDLARLIVEFAG
ncbi:alpha/beta fold hydrolase [Kribbella sp. NPDC051587]|uniref:alpha/beta fold hydrolase n=1 Tax=Kribbella sp. NPDC051587 TaxID=3364119 RepID=UPI0037BD776A